jgi:hypothetical protein
MKQPTIPILLISLLLGLAFDWFFYSKLPGISVFIYTALILGFTFYLARQFKSTLNKSIYWLVPVALFFSLMVFVRANLFLAVMNIFLVIYLLILVARLSRQPHTKLRQYEILQYFSPLIILPIGILNELFKILQRLMNNRNAKVHKSSYIPILRGFILSLPILIIFLLLLSSADLIFKEYINSFFDFSVAPESIFRWGLIGFVTSLFIGAYALIFMPTSAAETKPTHSTKKFDLGTTESSIILGSVSLLFFVFVAIQLAYLFGGSDQIASTGYTYAEYARKGFFELIVVAAISLLLIWTIKKTTSFRTTSQRLVFKWLSAILMVEVTVIMLSAHMRLNLYEEAYGFTMLRLLSHLFIAWLAFAFVLLLVHIVMEKNEKNFALHLFISALCFFALINLINPDDFIARQNIDRFNSVGKIDLYYLSNLSEDAVPVISGLLEHPNKDLQKSAASIMQKQKQFTVNHIANWQSTNLARQRADQIFRDNTAQIEASKSYKQPRELEAR